LRYTGNLIERKKINERNNAQLKVNEDKIQVIETSGLIKLAEMHEKKKGILGIYKGSESKSNIDLLANLESTKKDNSVIPPMSREINFSVVKQNEQKPENVMKKIHDSNIQDFFRKNEGSPCVIDSVSVIDIPYEIKKKSVNKSKLNEKTRTNLIYVETSPVEMSTFSEISSQDAGFLYKEVSKLRRDVVKLNKKLDTSERELDAQREELERAAKCIEKNRIGYKSDKEKLESDYKDEIEHLKLKQMSAIEALKDSHKRQISDMNIRIGKAQNARVKEGENMGMELEKMITREKDSLKINKKLADKNSTLSAQVSAIQVQMGVLQTRLETFKQTAENALERERKSDIRLDAALSLHVRQLSIRQDRETELERTVADLSSLLVAVRQPDRNKFDNGECCSLQTQINFDRVIVNLKEQGFALAEEIDGLKSQVILERERSQSLRKELEDISLERNQEISTTLARNKQYDSQISVLMSDVSQLQSSFTLKFSKTGRYRENEKTIELRKEVSYLSDELLRRRSQLDNASSEIVTLRNRLQAADIRTGNSVKILKSSLSRLDICDIEGGTPVGVHSLRARRNIKPKFTSIRSALKLNTERGIIMEQIGSLVDLVDNQAFDTGLFLCHHPFARGGFFLYFLTLQFWTFFFVIFRYQGFDDVSCMNVKSPEILANVSIP